MDRWYEAYKSETNPLRSAQKKELYIMKKENYLNKLLKGYYRFKTGRKELKVSDRSKEDFLSKLEKITPADRSGEYLEVWKPVKDVFRRPIPAFATVAALALLSISIYSYGFLPQAPLIHDIKGTVKIFDVGKNEWILAKNGEKVREADVIKTFKGSHVDISLGKLYSMRLKSDSEIEVKTLTKRMSRESARFSVAKGKVLAYYNKRGGKGKGGFELETNEIVAAVLGTNYMLESIPALGKTWLGVLDGVVKVTSKDTSSGVSPKEATVLVKSRYKTEVSRGAIPAKPELMIEEEWLQMKELYSIGKKPEVALLISTGSTRTRELLSFAPLYISDDVSSPLSSSFEKAARTYEEARKEGSIEKHLNAIKQFESIVEQPERDYDVVFLLFIGAYYDYIEYHDKAIGTFERILESYPASGLSSIAACAIGIIYEEKLNDRNRAIKAYRTIMSEYPNSPEREEATSGLSRLTQ
jgi:hypothetical protein